MNFVDEPGRVAILDLSSSKEVYDTHLYLVEVEVERERFRHSS
jgi:hypothetical protein